MKLKNSLFSSAIIWNNIKRFWWVSALYTLGLFLLSPLLALTNAGDYEWNAKISFDTIFDGTLLFLFTVPVFIAVIVFRYMQNSKSMVTMHAMPFSRLKLYINNIISGLILLLVPILLNTAFLSYIQLFSSQVIIFEQGCIMKFLWVSMLTATTLFALTTLVGMITGSSIAQIIFTYVLNFLVPALIFVFDELFSGIIYGFGGINVNFIEKVSLFSPIMQSIYLKNSAYMISDFLFADAIIVVISLVTGYFIYKFRNLENAGEVISGKYIKPIFKYGVTVCTMLVGTVYVKEIFNVDMPSLWIYIAFALIGYVISEMLLRKSVKILSSYKGFIGFIGVFAICAAGVYFDVFNYEDYIPKVENVKCFSLDDDSFDIKYASEDKPTHGVIFSQENINRIIKINEKIIENKETNRKEQSNIQITYKLNNGHIVRRNYKIKYDEYKEQLEEIYNTYEYKVAANDIFYKYPEDIYSIKVMSAPYWDDSSSVMLSSKEDIEEMLTAVKQDLIDLTYDEKENYSEIYEIQFMFNDATYKKTGARYVSQYFCFNEKAENVINVINKNGYNNQVNTIDTGVIELNN